MDKKFVFCGTKEQGYSAYRGTESFGKVCRTSEGWKITIQTPPPKKMTWNSSERCFYKSCSPGEETIPGFFKTRVEAAKAGWLRYVELYDIFLEPYKGKDLSSQKSP